MPKTCNTRIESVEGALPNDTEQDTLDIILCFYQLESIHAFRTATRDDPSECRAKQKAPPTLQVTEGVVHSCYSRKSFAKCLMHILAEYGNTCSRGLQLIARDLSLKPHSEFHNRLGS
jgi:hypothetical protein